MSSRVMGGHQPHVLPAFEYLARMSVCDVWVVSDDVKFNKGDWQNRNRIIHPLGDQLVTFPVAGKEDAVSLAERKLGYSPKSRWQDDLWKTFEMTYQKAPFWSEMTWFEDVLKKQRPETIGLFARAVLPVLTEKLGITTEVVFATDLKMPKFDNPSAKLAEQTKLLGCSTYATGPQGWTYLDPEPFKERGLSVRGFLFKCPEYRQRWMKNGFIRNLAVIDVITAVGFEEASKLIKGSIRLTEGQWGAL